MMNIGVIPTWPRRCLFIGGPADGLFRTVTPVPVFTVLHPDELDPSRYQYYDGLGANLKLYIYEGLSPDQAIERLLNNYRPVCDSMLKGHLDSLAKSLEDSLVKSLEDIKPETWRDRPPML